MEEKIEKQEMQTIGEMLRNARMKQNKTLEEISQELCIRKYYLNALENMDIDNIPPMPYGLGFVRSYSAFLGLNSDRIVASYRQVMCGGEDIEPSQNNSGPQSSSPRLKHILWAIVGLAVLAVAWSVFPTTTKFQDVSEENVEVVPEPVIVSEEEETAVLHAEEKQANAMPENNEIETENNIASETETKAENNAEESPSKETQTQENVPALPKKKMVLTGTSWLELRQGNKVLLSGIYNKGYEYEFPAENGLTITVGKPLNVKFFINEKEIPVVSKARRKNVSLDTYLKTQD